VVEAMKLAYADRDTYYADPAFVATPAEGLLSKEYAKERAALIDPNRASTSYVAGDPLPYDSTVNEWNYWRADLQVATADQASVESASPDLMASLGQDSHGVMKDTTHIAIVDDDGNMFDATPSGGWIGGAVILGDTGIGMSVRGEQFWLDSTRANHLRPRARQRYTLTPSMVFKGDVPMMALGTPGGDSQTQSLIQIVNNVFLFGMTPQAAIEAPRFRSYNGLRVDFEDRISPDVLSILGERGHDPRVIHGWTATFGGAQMIRVEASGTITAAADPRREAYAMAY